MVTRGSQAPALAGETWLQRDVDLVVEASPELLSQWGASALASRQPVLMTMQPRASFEREPDLSRPALEDPGPRQARPRTSV